MVAAQDIASKLVDTCEKKNRKYYAEGRRVSRKTSPRPLEDQGAHAVHAFLSILDASPEQAET
jgi:hypothetical protein